MKIGFFLVGILLILFGALWILQGTGVTPFGPMANKIGYAWLGGVTVLAGLVIAWLTVSRR